MQQETDVSPASFAFVEKCSGMSRLMNKIIFSGTYIGLSIFVVDLHNMAIQSSNIAVFFSALSARLNNTRKTN